MPRKPTVRYFPSRHAYYCQIDGKQHRLGPGPDDSSGGPNHLAAVEEYRKLLAKTAGGGAADQTAVRDLFNDYLDAIDGRVKPRTFELKRAMLKLFVDRFGHQAVKDVRPSQAESIVADMRRERTVGKRQVAWGDAQARIFLVNVSAAFTWAVRKEVIPRHPFRCLECPVPRTRARDRVMTPDEHAAVLEALRKPRSQRLRAIIVAFESTGARPAELAHATVADFNPQLGAVCYFGDDKRRQDEFAHKNSKRRDRTIYFTGEALDMVRQLARGKPGALLFPTNKGERYKGPVLAECFRALREKLALPHFIPYVYRHTLATRFLANGGSIDILAEILGNTPETIRRYYSHLCKEHGVIRSRLESFRQQTNP